MTPGRRTVDEQRHAVANVLSLQRGYVSARTRQHVVSAVLERLEVVAVLSGGVVQPTLLRAQAEQLVAAVLSELRGS